MSCTQPTTLPPSVLNPRGTSSICVVELYSTNKYVDQSLMRNCAQATRLLNLPTLPSHFPMPRK
eukprot:4941437-Prorocentrum_lima.AAC.1